MFYKNEHTYLGAVLLEQVIEGLGSDISDPENEWAWETRQDFLLMKDNVGDLTGYIV